MMSSGDVELRSVVKFCVALKKSPTETIKMIESTGKYKQCSPATVYKWHAPFRSGRDSVEDDPRCGRPAVLMFSVKEPVKVMMNRDRKTTVREIADKLHILVFTVHWILTDKQGISKVSARWVPRLVKDSIKECWVQCYEEFLTRYNAEVDTFLDRIITMDETWLHHFDPETKRMSTVGPEGRRKMDVHFFMDQHRMLLQHQVPHTVTAAYYSKINK